LVLSLYNVHARDISVPNVVVGMALFYGGLAQLLAGMWEFATGNTFGATGECLGKLSHHSFFVIQFGGVMVHMTCKSIITLSASPLHRDNLADILFFRV
jgi:succinate-acetate transporter protein